ncbi:MAG: hypothetical protein PHR30_05995 [Gallionellaceae bacterium]|nr:hypothetical protein [Gallionellaceae bacterium]
MNRTLRKSTLAMWILAPALAILVGAVTDALISDAAPGEAEMRAEVAAWGLTDLALFTEARYTRHPSQADRHAAFQDHPGALEHFPSGALMPPPPHLREPTGP